MRFLNTLPLAIIAALFTSCVAPAAYQTVPMPDQDVALEEDSNGRFYIIRKEQTLWSRFPLRVYIADEEIGSLAPGTYMCIEREPGRVLTRLILDRPRAEGGTIEQLYDTNIEEGTVRWIQAAVHTNDQLVTTTELDSDEGPQRVAEYGAAEVR